MRHLHPFHFRSKATPPTAADIENIVGDQCRGRFGARSGPIDVVEARKIALREFKIALGDKLRGVLREFGTAATFELTIALFQLVACVAHQVEPFENGDDILTILYIVAILNVLAFARCMMFANFLPKTMLVALFVVTYPWMILAIYYSHTDHRLALTTHVPLSGGLSLMLACVFLYMAWRSWVVFIIWSDRSQKLSIYRYNCWKSKIYRDESIRKSDIIEVVGTVSVSQKSDGEFLSVKYRARNSYWICLTKSCCAKTVYMWVPNAARVECSPVPAHVGSKLRAMYSHEYVDERFPQIFGARLRHVTDGMWFKVVRLFGNCEFTRLRIVCATPSRRGHLHRARDPSRSRSSAGTPKSSSAKDPRMGSHLGSRSRKHVKKRIREHIQREQRKRAREKEKIERDFEQMTN